MLHLDRDTCTQAGRSRRGMLPLERVAPAGEAAGASFEVGILQEGVLLPELRNPPHCIQPSSGKRLLRWEGSR